VFLHRHELAEEFTGTSFNDIDEDWESKPFLPTFSEWVNIAYSKLSVCYSVGNMIITCIL
jgi:hypothetical protein